MLFLLEGFMFEFFFKMDNILWKEKWFCVLINLNMLCCKIWVGKYFKVDSVLFEI